ncbi:sugar porter family MFS transporter [Parafilimonas sp.]|uniref:sugar porter family MFS transporter n=1 Tax=Parafilimonas sp. TaxID=1969739 RepID=UPI003F7D0B39
MNKKKVLLWSIVVALGGFLFGFDTAVISGAEESIQQYWSLNSVEHGLTISIALIGTIIGALTGSMPADKLGRKKTLILIAVAYLIASVGTCFSTNWYSFLLFRLIGGLGVGASSVTAPVYISEISPAAYRGRLVMMFQFNVVFGILVSYLSNYVIGIVFNNDYSWRVMLGIQAIPSLIFLILLRFVPETPRWLILNKQPDKAASILKIIDPGNYENDIREIIANNKEEHEIDAGDMLFSRKNKLPVFLAVCFAIFNQVSGINAIIYYAPRIFEMAGLGRQSSLLSTTGIGLINFLFTLIAINFIDKIGRRTLMIIGSVGLIGTLGLVSKTFYAQDFSGFGIIVYLMIYIAFFAFSQGAVIWVFISEIFPNNIRAKGQTLGSFTHWLMAAVITFLFPVLSEKLGGGNTFLFFSIMMVLQLLFVLKIMPETKGKSLEQIERALILH